MEEEYMWAAWERCLLYKDAFLENRRMKAEQTASIPIPSGCSVYIVALPILNYFAFAPLPVEL